MNDNVKYMKNRLLELAQRRVDLEYGYNQMSPSEREAAAIEVSQIKEMVAMYKKIISEREAAAIEVSQIKEMVAMYKKIISEI